MKKSTSKAGASEMKAEYDFSGGIRGTYGQQDEQATNVVLLDPELVIAFPNVKALKAGV